MSIEKFISVIVFLVIVTISGSFLYGCSIINTEFTKQLKSCSDAGGSYVPSGNNNNYQCLNVKR